MRVIPSVYNDYSVVSGTVTFFQSGLFYNIVIRASWSYNIRRLDYIARCSTATQIDHIFGANGRLRVLYSLRILILRLLPDIGSSKILHSYSMAREDSGRYFEMLMHLEENYRSNSRFFNYMGEMHRLGRFQLLDYDCQTVVSCYHKIFEEVLQHWTHAKHIWSRNAVGTTL